MPTTLTAMRIGLRNTLASAVFAAAVVTLAPPLGAAVPQAARVPVPDGRYGAVDAPTTTGAGNCFNPTDTVCYLPQQFVGFTVRNRKIVNPRIAIKVTCNYTDGTSSVVTFGPTSNNPDRTSPVPRSGNGTISWVEEFDSSLIRNATVSMSYTFRRNGNHLVGVEVRSSDVESTCYGTTPFRLGDVSEVPASIFDPRP